MADAKVLSEILVVLKRIDARLAAALEADGIEMGDRCEHCGLADLVEDTAFGDPKRRLACRDCGKVTLKEAVVHG